MLVFFALNSVLRGQHWWIMASLLGTAVYGPSALRQGTFRGALAGIALQIFFCGISGALFGVVLARVRGSLTRLAAGLVCGAAWYFLSYEVLFPVISPLVPVYATRAVPLMGHLLFGLSLSRVSAIAAPAAIDPESMPPPLPELPSE